MNTTVSVLGSTGSVGRQTMDVCALHSLTVDGIAGGSNITLLEEQIRRFSPRLCAVADEAAAQLLKIAVADTNTKVVAGNDGILEVAAAEAPRTVFNSIIGTAGLIPTLTAIDAGKNVALANKETLVVAGEVVMRRAKERGVSVLPVDSEHCAIFQCLHSENHDRVKRLYLTCSGGAFYGKTRGELADMTPREALAHPTWNMGQKITVDCATLMNKGLELIEAVRLFDVRPDQVEVLIHRESIVHSMVQYADNAVMAQLSVPDMRLCIQYALTYPDRLPSCIGELDFLLHNRLTFAAPDTENFPLLALARRAVTEGGVVPAVLNGANEAAVSAFLKEQIRFGQIDALVARAVEDAPRIADPSLDDFIAADRSGREAVALALSK